ncbi:MAG: hydrogenase nickel incorporation protein HypA [Spirochaetes bacterium]|nr:hydrogenase nickel incorporation protein HypA [Spirochaetota bacterium]
MHEWALAEAVIATVEKRVEPREGRSPGSVTVLIGELQAIDREIFAFALESLLAGSALPAGLFRMETEPAEFLCRACGRRWGLAEEAGLTVEQREAIHFLPESAHAFVRCPACGSMDFGVEKGRGVSIVEAGS